MQFKLKTKQFFNRSKRFLKAHKEILFSFFLIFLLGLILVLVSIANYFLLIIQNNNNKILSILNKESITSDLYFTNTSTTYNATTHSTIYNATILSTTYNFTNPSTTKENACRRQHYGIQFIILY